MWRSSHEHDQDGLSKTLQSSHKQEYVFFSICASTCFLMCSSRSLESNSHEQPRHLQGIRDGVAGDEGSATSVDRDGSEVEVIKVDSDFNEDEAWGEAG